MDEEANVMDLCFLGFSFVGIYVGRNFYADYSDGLIENAKGRWPKWGVVWRGTNKNLPTSALQATDPHGRIKELSRIRSTGVMIMTYGLRIFRSLITTCNHNIFLPLHLCCTYFSLHLATKTGVCEFNSRFNGRM